MQDKYRFRFWDEKAQKWFYFGFETFPTYEKEIWKALTDGEKIYQCTGLKDKNGKNIFEGDIVKFKLLEDFEVFGTKEKYFEIIAPIVFKDGGFFIEQPENNIFLGQFPMSEIEVIGSILENSELLKGGCNGKN